MTGETGGHGSFQAPPALGDGDRVAVIAPAGPPHAPGEVARCAAAIASLGFEPVVGQHCDQRLGYFSARDEERLADLNTAIRDDTIRAIMAIRGGYGCARLLRGADWDALATRPKMLVGFSDLTALLVTCLDRARLRALHASTIAMGFVHEGMTPGALAVFKRLLRDPEPLGSLGEAMGWSARWVLAPPGQGKVTGWLTGGNLAVLASLAGTPWQPGNAGAILFLEDVGEFTYRVDRQVWQLRESGLFDGVAAVVLGHFTACPPRRPGEPEVEDTLRDCLSGLGIPVMAGFPAGHEVDNCPLPLGCMAEVDFDRGDIRVLDGFAGKG